MQELIGYYIPMEEYYMRESVNKVQHTLDDDDAVIFECTLNFSINFCPLYADTFSECMN